MHIILRKVQRLLEETLLVETRRRVVVVLYQVITQPITRNTRTPHTELGPLATRCLAKRLPTCSQNETLKLLHQQKRLLAAVDFMDFVDFTWILHYAINQMGDSVDSAQRN